MSSVPHTHADSLSLEGSPTCEDNAALYTGVQKKPAAPPDSPSLPSLLQERRSLDGDSDSLTTSPSSSSLDAWSGHKLIKTFGKSGGGHGLVRPAKKPGAGEVRGSGSSFSEADGCGPEEDAGKASRSMTDGEMRKALNSLSHGVSSESVYGFYGLTRPRPHLLVSLEDVHSPKRLSRPKGRDPNYAYSSKHLMYQRSRPKLHGPPSSAAHCDLQLLREKGKGGGGGGGGGGWPFPARKLRGRTAVSEFNITYVVERSLYGHLNWAQLVRPVAERTLSKAERQDLRRCLLEEDGEVDRKWASSVDRCTKRVLLRIQQKSVSRRG